MKHSRSVIIAAAVGVIVALSGAATFRVALAAGPCSAIISERNAASDVERSSQRSLDAARRELADANVSDPRRVDKVLGDTLAEIQADKKTISVLEHNDEIPGLMARAKAALRKAQTRLEFYQAKQTQILAGEAVTIQPPAGYADDLKKRVVDLDAEHAQAAKRLADLDRKVAACRANTGGPDVGGAWVFTVSYPTFSTVWDLNLDGSGPWHGTALAEPGPVAPGTRMACYANRGADGKLVITCGKDSYCPGGPQGSGFAGECNGYSWTLRKK